MYLLHCLPRAVYILSFRIFFISSATILWILVKKGFPMVSDWRECFANACLALRPKDLPMASLVGDNAYYFTTPWYVTTTCIIQNNTFVIKVSLILNHLYSILVERPQQLIV